MTSFSFLPLGGFLSVSLSLSYLRENNKAQRQKQDALCLTQDYHNNTDTWRNVPASTPHGVQHMFKSLEAAALMLRMGSETIRHAISPAEHKILYETLSYLEQRDQLCMAQLHRTVVIEGPPGKFHFLSCALMWTTIGPDSCSIVV